MSQMPKRQRERDAPIAHPSSLYGGKLMQYDQFIGEVQNRARLPSEGEAIAAVRATLQTLAERLAGGATDNLAAQLPKRSANISA